jgi:hypothetical protein
MLFECYMITQRKTLPPETFYSCYGPTDNFDMYAFSVHQSTAQIGFVFFIHRVRHSTAISYPSIENLFNGCQGHPLDCPPPGTAQRQPDRK